MSRMKRGSLPRYGEIAGDGSKRDTKGVGDRRRILLLPVLVFVASLLPFIGTVGNGFVAYDDDRYVTANPVVARGVTVAGAAWAFTTIENANWHPLTWLSHMADVSLFGMDPAGHHVTNVLLHGANSLLLFLFLRRAGGNEWASVLAALLFGVHPLRVEVVAWVSERKELLCTLFQLLGLHAYLSYARAPGWKSYLPVPAFMSLALLSKPMAVTFPFVLLLLDYWPLGRTRLSPVDHRGADLPPTSASRLLSEKIPLFLLASAAAIMTMKTQGALGSILPVPFSVRIGNALLSLGSYLRLTVLPYGLSVFHPHPGASIPAWKLGASAGAISAVTLLAYRERARRPSLLVGWLIFVGTLVPVLGLVQAGFQAMAERYSYLPSVGLSMAAAFAFTSSPAVSSSGERSTLTERLVPFLTAALLLALSTGTFLRSREWKDTGSLFTAALRVDPLNWVALKALGVEAARDGDTARALSFYSQAAAIMPGEPDLRFNLGCALLGRGDPAGGESNFREVVRLSPGDGEAWGLLGLSLARQNRKAEAEAAWRTALRLEPGNETARRGLERIGRGGGAP